MILVNIYEMKAKLSEYLEAVAKGERVVICKRNRPVAELKAVASAPAAPRPVGTAKGRFTIPDSFFQPLPEEIVEAFHGMTDGAPRSRAAESAAKYETPRGRRPKGRR